MKVEDGFLGVVSMGLGSHLVFPLSDTAESIQQTQDLRAGISLAWGHNEEREALQFRGAMGWRRAAAGSDGRRAAMLAGVEERRGVGRRNEAQVEKLAMADQAALNPNRLA